MDSLHTLIDFESYIVDLAANIAAAGPMDAAEVPILLLTCMDFRYHHMILSIMDAAGLRKKYDQLILAGAGLGVTHKKEWETTFLDQLKFAIKHHHVKYLIIFEHRDCGAYKVFKGITPDKPEEERLAHIHYSSEAVKIARKHCSLEMTYCLLLPIELMEPKWLVEELPLEKTHN